MNNEIVAREKVSIVDDIIETNKICKELMNTPHYKKLGEAGMRLIVEKAKSMGMHPVEALNGGLYNVQGKIEMTGQSMLSMIRQAGHSITKDPKSTQTNVILHGERKDGACDKWTVSFSIDDAKRAGIYRGMWEKYPEVMCTWRCVSMLGRFLFSDLLKGAYIEGEISESISSRAYVEPLQPVEQETVSSINPPITDEQYLQLEEYLVGNDELKNNILSYLEKKWGIDDIKEMPVSMFAKTLKRAQDLWESQRKETVEEVTNG